jgi:hypothetical protein
VYERSILSSVLGLPGYAAIGIALGFTGLGVFIDLNRINGLGAIFKGCYFAGCVLAVCWVKRRALFGPMVQPPLLLAVAVPAVVLLSGQGGGASAGLTDHLLSIGAPLLNGFPTMAVTTAFAVAIGLVRYALQRPSPAELARRGSPGPPPAGRPERRRPAGERRTAAERANAPERGPAAARAGAAERAPGERRPGRRAPADRAQSDRAQSDRAPGDRAPSERKAADRKPGERRPGERKPGDRRPGDRRPPPDRLPPGARPPADRRPPPDRIPPDRVPPPERRTRDRRTEQPPPGTDRRPPPDRRPGERPPARGTRPS